MMCVLSFLSVQLREVLCADFCFCNRNFIVLSHTVYHFNILKDIYYKIMNPFSICTTGQHPIFIFLFLTILQN